MKKSNYLAIMALSSLVFGCGGGGAAGMGGGPVVVAPPPAPPPPPPPPVATLSVTADPANRSVTADMLVLSPKISGRVVTAPISGTLPAGSKSYTHEWPAVYFEAAFNGDSFVAKLDDPNNEYRLFIDSLAPVRLAQPGNAEYKISGLSNGAHKIRLEKVTESIGIRGTFSGFYIPKNAAAAAAPVRARQIEYIGDSDMAGYGLRSNTRQCTQEEVRLLSDTQLTYPAKTAKRFNADYQVNAISGRGMARNYDGFDPQIIMPLVYPYSLSDQSSAYMDEAWQPQIIVVALGANDFATALKAGEKWAAPKDLIADYFATYERFLRTLYSRNRGANLIVLWPDTPRLTNAADITLYENGQNQLATKAQAIGFKSTEFTKIPNLGLELSACDFHASESDHEKMTQWLISKLDANPQYWNGK
jgi:lysophospholipase L1-like esterase